MPFYRPVHTGPLAELVSYFFAAALVAVRSYTQFAPFRIRLF
jgi:hypothetical protein